MKNKALIIWLSSFIICLQSWITFWYEYKKETNINLDKSYVENFEKKLNYLENPFKVIDSDYKNWIINKETWQKSWESINKNESNKNTNYIKELNQTKKEEIKNINQNIRDNIKDNIQEMKTINKNLRLERQEYIKKTVNEKREYINNMKNNLDIRRKNEFKNAELIINKAIERNNNIEWLEKRLLLIENNINIIEKLNIDEAQKNLITITLLDLEIKIQDRITNLKSEEFNLENILKNIFEM